MFTCSIHELKRDHSATSTYSLEATDPSVRNPRSRRTAPAPDPARLQNSRRRSSRAKPYRRGNLEPAVNKYGRSLAHVKNSTCRTWTHRRRVAPHTRKTEHCGPGLFCRAFCRRTRNFQSILAKDASKSYIVSYRSSANVAREQAVGSSTVPSRADSLSGTLLLIIRPRSLIKSSV